MAEYIEHVNSYEIHKNKLDAIRRDIELKQINKHKVLDEKAELLKLRILNNKLKSHEFVENEKINGIKKNNQLLLDRLLDISKGKFASPGMKHRLPKTRKGPKSLNQVKKKKELERIDQENMKLMNRIVNQNAMLNTKKMEQEFRDRRKMQKSLQRNKLAPIKSLLKKKKQLHERSTGRLPSLQNVNTPSMKDNENGKLPQSVSSSKKDKPALEINENSPDDNHNQNDDQNTNPKKTPVAKQSRESGSKKQTRPEIAKKVGNLCAIS